MNTWLPPEILVKILSYVSDIGDLLAVRQVKHEWSEAAETELKRWGCVSLDPASIVKFKSVWKKKAVRERITDAAIIFPDRDYWRVSVQRMNNFDDTR